MSLSSYKEKGTEYSPWFLMIQVPWWVWTYFVFVDLGVL